MRSLRRRQVSLQGKLQAEASHSEYGKRNRDPQKASPNACAVQQAHTADQQAGQRSDAPGQTGKMVHLGESWAKSRLSVRALFKRSPGLFKCYPVYHTGGVF